MALFAGLAWAPCTPGNKPLHGRVWLPLHRSPCTPSSCAWPRPSYKEAWNAIALRSSQRSCALVHEPGLLELLHLPRPLQLAGWPNTRQLSVGSQLSLPHLPTAACEVREADSQLEPKARSTLSGTEAVRLMRRVWYRVSSHFPLK